MLQPASIILVLISAILSLCAPCSAGITRQLPVAAYTHQTTLNLPSLDTDPLAKVSPLFGHSATGRTYAMPAVPQAHEQAGQGTGLQPNYEINRPTRILPSKDLKSCTITLATHSFANR
jgi:hypothetical protein